MVDNQRYVRIRITIFFSPIKLYIRQGILVLNLFLTIPVLASVINGYDASLVNGESVVQSFLRLRLIRYLRVANCTRVAELLS